MVFKLIYPIIIISCNIFGLVSYPANEYEDLPCGEGNAKGTCKLVVECPVAAEALMHKRKPNLERCGFDGFLEVVCCPDTKPDVRAPVTTRKSEIACKEYSNEVFPDPTLHILGGENATLGEFPHMAALGYESDEASGGIKWACGGSLISYRFVLTAAHCVIKQDGIRPSKVRMGMIDLIGNDNEPQEFGVINFTVHSEYNRGKKINDIALLQLDNDVKKGHKNVYPACLYQNSDNPLGLVITGWGFTKASGEPSRILQKAKIHPVDGTECSTIYESRLARGIIASQICAVSDDGTIDTCQGDSGGPLQVQQTGGSSIYSIVGVTSYGMACGGKTPGIYTRISSYLEWIENIVWP